MLVRLTRSGDAPKIAEMSPSDVFLGQVFSHYRVLEKLDRGGMGIVYRAEDLELSRFVAIKLLPDNLPRDQMASDRFLREARAAASLNHPNICTIHDFGEHEGRRFLVMELLEGQTLKQRIRGQSLTTKELLEVGMQIASVLGAAHAKGIIHRDIKPANIFLTEHEQAKLLDFGLAKQIPRDERGDQTVTSSSEDLTVAGRTLGTVAYMSPEQARGRDLDGRSDIFSLGLVFYEMATGRQAFPGSTSAEIFDGILNRTPPALSSLNPEAPRELERIINRCLEKLPSDRYASADELRVDLQNLSRALESAQPFQASQPSATAPRTAKKSSSRLGHSLAAIAATVVLLIAIFLGYSRLHRVSAYTEKDSLVLAEISNSTSDGDFDGTLKQALLVSLSQSPYFNLVSDEKIRQTLKQMERPADTRLTTEVAREICQRQGAKAVLTGTLSQLGTRYVLTLSAQDAVNGEQLAYAQTRANSKETVLDALDKASVQLRGKLGESLASLQKFDKPLEQATTSSLPALKALTLGNAQLRNGDSLEAIPFFKRAIELDPDFADAYSSLAGTYFNMAQPELALRYSEEAFKRKDRATEAERYAILSSYYFYRNQVEEAIRTYEVFTKTYPRVPTAFGNLAAQYLALGRFDKALTNSLEALKLAPENYLAYSDAAMSYLGLNRVAEAKAILQEAEHHNIGGFYLHQQLGDIAILEGDVEAQVKEDALARTNPEGELNLMGRDGSLADKHGRIREARELLTKSSVLASRLDLKELATNNMAYQATFEALVGNRKEGLQMADKIIEQSQGVNDLLNVADVYARVGKEEKALQLAKTASDQRPADTMVHNVSLPMIRATIALNHGDAAKALQELKAAENYDGAQAELLYTRGIAYLRAQDPARAVEEFNKVLSLQAFYAEDPTIALAQLGLARAHAAAGDKPKARAAYNSFFLLWKDADPNVPILKQAQFEFSQL